MGLFARLAGVVGSSFQVGGPGGPAWKNNGGSLDARNAGDSAYINVRGLDPVGAQDLVTLGYFNLHVNGQNDLLLAAAPTQSCTYVASYAGSQLNSEVWTRTPGNKLKEIDYSYSGGNVSQEVRSVYATDGVTVVAQLTIVYTSYNGSRPASATYTRNV